MLNYDMSVFLHNPAEDAMHSTINAKGQTVVPVAIRRQFRLGSADRLQWIVGTGFISVVPVHANPVQAFRGQGSGGATARLLLARTAEG